jgi:NADH dehydrogenase
MASYALPLKTLGDALFLRNRVISRLEQAELQPDVEHRRWLTTFLVVGGGFSGVETAGELADFAESSLRYYRCVKREDVRIVLIHSGARLLPELSGPLGDFTVKRMRANGVEVLLETRVVRVTDLGVELDNGARIGGGTIICTIGTAPSALVDSIAAPKVRGRVAVNADLSVPEVQGVWAVGDCAAAINAMDGKVCPPTAQFADAQAKVLARNIVSRLKGLPTEAFHYRPKGQLSSIGHTKAVAEIYGWKLSGFTAWLLWRTLYLMRMPTFSRRARLFLEWTWAMFFPPDLAHFGYRRSARRHTEMQPPPMPPTPPKAE